jgi:hypothetical protein
MGRSTSYVFLECGDETSQVVITWREKNFQFSGFPNVTLTRGYLRCTFRIRRAEENNDAFEIAQAEEPDSDLED